MKRHCKDEEAILLKAWKYVKPDAFDKIGDLVTPTVLPRGSHSLDLLAYLQEEVGKLTNVLLACPNSALAELSELSWIQRCERVWQQILTSSDLLEYCNLLDY